jgi:hypothetical protein
MSDEPAGVYLPTAEDNVYESTQAANAGWYEEGQHAGALAALVVGHVDAVPSLVDMNIARMTFEVFRVVPIVPLRIDTSVVREGKKIQVLEVKVTDPEGLELVRAHIQRLRSKDVALPEGVVEARPVFPGPDLLEPPTGKPWGHGPESKVMFHRSAIEAREIEGGFSSTGPGSLWMRVIRPIIAGREITPIQRLVVVADFCNGVSRLSLEPNFLFMNPDLTVNVTATPSGEWVALSAESWYAADGRGVASGTLWDEDRFLGRSTQTLFLDRAI